MTCILVLAVCLPSKYTSHLKLLVKNEREHPLLSIGEQTQGMVNLDDVSDARISTEMELLNSRDLLRHVVGQTHLDALVSRRISGGEKRAEVAVRDLRRALTITPAHRSQVIEVTYESTDPVRSAQVLRALSALYQHSATELHGAPGSFAFFDGEWKKSTGELHAAEEQMAEFRRATQIVSLPEEKSSLLQHIAELRRELAQSSASESKSSQEARSYVSSIASLPPTIEKERRSIPNQESMQALSAMLVALQNKRVEAAARYRPDDRMITDVDAQIDATREAIRNQQDAPAQEIARGENQAFVSSQTDLVRARASFAGGAAQSTNLAAQLRRSQLQLARLDASTITYSDLTRRIVELTSMVGTYRKKRDESQIGESLDRQQFSNVAVVEEPAVERIASSPHRGIILAIGAIWSLALAVGIVLVLEGLDKHIETQMDLELALGLPVLMGLPGDIHPSQSCREFATLYLAMQRTPLLIDLEAL